ncbi:MAG: S41 family peptidase [Bacteroidaceae bacterium]|nr:S41 family peptidase [Bacteroidaceae bacterium]
MNKNKKYRNYLPLIITISLVAGIVLGTFYAGYFRSNRLSIFSHTNNKINDLLFTIEDRYADTVNIDDLVEKSLPRILSELDPHSTYTSAKKVEEEMMELKGSFSGIGIIFSIIQDTARVVRVVEGGPSEDVGLMAGDRIVKVDGKSFIGDFLNEEYATKTLRGPKDSSVKLGILRVGEKGIKTYEITRGAVPVKTIDAYAMLNKNTGYIHISSFGENTYAELLVALTDLNNSGCRNLILDLRDNGGGYMNTAIQVANEFLPEKQLIVYTEGRKSERMEYFSDGRGNYKKIPLVVIVNENSASASEILAAAIQDNDRGTIVGLRTFGKGLVQEPIQFADGSLLKLTIARYYSPSGRCLQKPFVRGETENYQNDIYSRYVNGEFSTQDSIHLSGKKYHTKLGRVVYGGGGVTPDIFIAADTSDITSYFMEAFTSKRLIEFAYNFTDTHRKALNDLSDWKEIDKYLNKQKIVDKFVTYAESKGQKRRNLLIKKSYQRLYKTLVSTIINNVLGNKDAVLFQCQSDKNILKALSIIEEGQTFPKPITNTSTDKPKKKNKGK